MYYKEIQAAQAQNKNMMSYQIQVINYRIKVMNYPNYRVFYNLARFNCF